MRKRNPSPDSVLSPGAMCRAYPGAMSSASPLSSAPAALSLARDLDQVPAGVVEHGRGDRLHLERLLGELDSQCAQPLVFDVLFTFATVVAVINSVVGASAIAIALGAIADASLGIAAGVGGVAALISLVALLRYADRLLEERAGRTESIFPSPLP
jgi:hypothetical protein